MAQNPAVAITYTCDLLRQAQQLIVEAKESNLD